MTRTVLCLVLLTLCISPIAARAEEDPSASLQERIEQINGQITKESSLLDEVQGRISEVNGKLQALKTEGDKLRAEDRTLSKKLTSVNAERQRLEEELQELDAERDRIAQLSIRRLRATYVNPPGQTLTDLFRQVSSPSLSHLGFYLAAVRSFDRRTLDSLAELKRSRQEKRTELAGATTTQERVVQEIKQKRARIAQQVAAQEPLAKELRAQLADREMVVTQLRAQLLRFETVLAGLTGGGNDEMTRLSTRISSKRSALSAVVAPEPFKGDGLAAFKGRLNPPVDGRLVVGFGKQVMTKTGIAGASKGVEFAAAAGAEVRAVANGKVIFSGRMPVLGNILILDHGERYYTLYGRLAAAQVERGSEVALNQPIGAVGEADVDGRSFYFEIRKNGAPVNPQPFLRQKK